jgi:type IV pilus assembly protein PilE
LRNNKRIISLLTWKEDEMKTENGFSLIELLVAVTILAILAAVAIPSYQSYVIKSNRAAAQSFMMDLANREKQYMLDARTYADIATLGVSAPTDVSKHYTLAIVSIVTPPSFTITATPSSSQQTSDGALTLGSDGSKGPADKW